MEEKEFCKHCGALKGRIVDGKGTIILRCPDCGCGDTLILPKEDCAGQE